MYLGSCQCGSTQYSINGEIVDIIYCHCSMCRKLSGSAFLSFGSVKHQNFNLLTDDSSIVSYQATEKATRSFCSKCGSTLFWSDHSDYGREYICIALGTLDSDFHPNKWKHFYTEHKASWYPILDHHQEFKSCS